MSKRNRREHGRIISVETKTRGDSLADDVAAGVTSITVEDAGDFDEDGGWLLIGGQVVEFTECDDDTGVITLADPLTAAAEQGDPVQVWSELYEEVVDYQQALVELDGEYDNPDPVVAEVAEGVGSLPEGDRGKAGESCTLHRVGEDEWEVVGVGGRGRQSQGVLFYQDSHTVAAAGAQAVALTHLPIDNSEHVYWNGLYQPGSEWTRDGQTITAPDPGGLLAVNDELVVEYAYRKGISTATIVGSYSPTVHGTSSYIGGGGFTSVPLPAGTESGDLVVFVTIGVSTNDARFTNYGPGTWNVYVGFASDLSAISVSAPLNPSSWAMAAFNPGAIVGHQTINYPDATCPTVAASAAILGVNESSSNQQFAASPVPPAGYVGVVASDTGFQKNAIYVWSDPAASSSPAGTIRYGFGYQGGTAVAVGLQ